MKLWYSPTSPYVRKVMVTAIKTGLINRIDVIPTVSGDLSSGIAQDNPLGKIPTLVTDGGEALYDSPVICEYLDSLHDGVKLFPPSGGARWRALRRQALADGIMDAGILRFLELKKRPEGERSPGWMEHNLAAVYRGLDALEEEADALADGVTIGHIAIAVMLGWLDFRREPGDWRVGRPSLAAWYDTFSARRSMTETAPKDPT
jgi:glutathione S-transferase